MLCAALGILLGIVAPSPFGAFSLQAEAKAPVPEAAAQKDAEKLVRDLFKDEYAKKSPQERLSLAKILLDQASKSADDSVSRFVLLRECRDIAVQAGDQELSLKAIAEIARLYEGDVTSMKLAVLATLGRGAKAPEDYAKLAKAYLAAIDGALASEQYELAEKAADQAASMAKRAKEVSLAAKADARQKQISDRKGKYERNRKALETLQSSPDDQASHLSVGLYETLIRGHWDTGFEHLEKCSDTILKGLAERELAQPTDALEQVAVADAWWELVEKEKDSTYKDAELRRARYWYRQAYPKLSGLPKSKSEKRMGDPLADKFGGTWIEVADPKDFGVLGKPGDPMEFKATRDKPVVAILRKMPSGEFDGVMVRIRHNLDMNVIAGLYYEGEKILGFMDIPHKKYVQVSLSGDGRIWIPEKDAELEPKKEYTLTIINSNGEYIHYVDGQEMLRHKATISKIATVGFDIMNDTATVDQIRLRRKE